MRLKYLPAFWAVVASISSFASAVGPEVTGGRVNNLKVLSDKIDDVTTVENIVKSFCKPGMSDQKRSQALWTAAVKYRHQTAPPNEFLAGDWEAHDPVKIFNVYGYCMCCCSSALIEALNRADGRETRGRILNGHSVPEVRYGDGWHMFDASLITNFPKSDGVVASVDEIAASVAGWYAQHPGYQKNGAKILELMRSDGWMGWKAQGPELLANCPYYKMGYFPARTHGWDATMAEYDRKPEVYEYGYQVGHRALFSLRPGESFVREAGNRGLHVNMDQDPNWDGLKVRAPQNDLVYVNEFLPGYRGGVVANGIQRYEPNLAAGDLERGAEVFDNLVSGGSPGLRVKDPSKPGVVVIPMVSPYVYLGGKLRLEASCRSIVGTPAHLKVVCSISTNNGRTFAVLGETSLKNEGAVNGTGGSKDELALKNWTFRRYAYWVKIEIDASSSEGAGIDSLVIENDIQHAPRTLPSLGKGKNTITVAADVNTEIATRAVVCRLTSDPSFSKNETSSTMGITFDNLRVEDGSCWWKGGVGTMTVPIEVPGDLVALGFSTQYRARDSKDVIQIRTSTDAGQTWRDAGRIAGPTQGATHHRRLADWPASTRKVLLRFEMTGRNTVGFLSFRADADYRDPLAARTLHPIHVVHRWTENGQAKSHDETITKLPASYTIEATAEPEMDSVTYRMPAGR